MRFEKVEITYHPGWPMNHTGYKYRIEGHFSGVPTHNWACYDYKIKGDSITMVTSDKNHVGGSCRVHILADMIVEKGV